MYVNHWLIHISGLERPHLRLGDSTRAAIVDVTAVLPVADAPHLHVVVVVTTPLVGMTGMNGTMTVMTEIMNAVTATMNAATEIMIAVTVNVLVIVPAALMKGIVTWRMIEKGVKMSGNAAKMNEKMGPMAKREKVSFPHIVNT